jgi:hypothetical protein
LSSIGLKLTEVLIEAGDVQVQSSHLVGDLLEPQIVHLDLTAHLIDHLVRVATSTLTLASCNFFCKQIATRAQVFHGLVFRAEVGALGGYFRVEVGDRVIIMLNFRVAVDRFHNFRWILARTNLILKPLELLTVDGKLEINVHLRPAQIHQLRLARGQAGGAALAADVQPALTVANGVDEVGALLLISLKDGV